MYCATTTLRAWTPNIGTDAFFVAVTITVVEQAIRREEKRRVRPRVESAMYHTRLAMKMFAESVVIDYSGTHLHTFRPVERDMLDFLEQWLADADNKDACSAPIDGTYSLVMHAGAELGNFLRDLRQHDRDVMEPDLIRALDDYLWLGAQQWDDDALVRVRSIRPRSTGKLCSRRAHRRERGEEVRRGAAAERQARADHLRGPHLARRRGAQPPHA
jgi:hypothetical protein